MKKIVEPNIALGITTSEELAYIIKMLLGLRREKIFKLVDGITMFSYLNDYEIVEAQKEVFNWLNT